MRPIAYLTGIGWYVGASIIIGVILGRWADGQLNTDPVFTIVGVLVGLAVALYGGIRMLVNFLASVEPKNSDRTE
jgi:F0F1-type ATP synthase assembly protein I